MEQTLAREVFVIRRPEVEPVPLVVSIPHTGTYVPDDIAASFASDYIRSLPMTDWHLHELYDFLPHMGITTVYATYSRFVADLNRPPDAQPLYPGRFETGLVSLETFQGEPIYGEPPAPEEIEARRELVHAPYHAALQALLDETNARFGHAVLIDAHSVATHASKLHGELTEDIYLGNRDESTCAPWLIDSVEAAMRAGGLRTVRNRPYKGGYITAHYGALDWVDALQIEMAQPVYMDQADPAGALEHPRFERTREILTAMFGAVIEHIRKR